MIDFNIAGYLIFAFVSSITPGPNNFMLFSYGKQFGYKDSTKLLLGIFFGFIVLLYASGYGIAQVITNNPTIGLVLKIVSSIWLLYLAFVLSKLNSEISVESKSKIGFYQGFFMQFINPKAWIMALSGASAFMPHLDSIHLSVFIFAFMFGLVGIPCMIVWISFGDLISKLLKSEKANRIVGYTLFLLMILSIVMIWL
ncbi:MAG: LysE family translocator [Bacteroidales bacterium]|nr:MAG: LysE family translocator [Bacteroidales bacterium]